MTASSSSPAAHAGLGRATAEALAAEGARVVVSGRSQEHVDAAVTALGVLGENRAVGVAADNADPATPGRLIAAAQDRWGRLDGALVSVGGPPPGRSTAITDEQWTAAFESVFLGSVRLAREIGAALGDDGSLALVLSTSVRQPVPDLTVSNGFRPGWRWSPRTSPTSSARAASGSTGCCRAG